MAGAPVADKGPPGHVSITCQPSDIELLGVPTLHRRPTNARSVLVLGSGLVRRRAFILGAGFSAAVSPLMPVTDDLGEQAVTLLTASGLTLPRGRTTYFEEWLSRLAEDQPDLSEAENLANRSLAVRLSESIAEVVRTRQTEAWVAGPPDWLHRFVAVLHVWRATAITFNYDTLIEKAVDTHVLIDWTAKTHGQIEHSNVLDELPPLPPGWGSMSRRTFQLLKLHGSVNWWSVPGDASGATTNRTNSLAMGEDTPEAELESPPPTWSDTLHRTAQRPQEQLLQQPDHQGVVAARGQSPGRSGRPIPRRLFSASDRSGNRRNAAGTTARKCQRHRDQSIAKRRGRTTQAARYRPGTCPDD